MKVSVPLFSEILLGFEGALLFDPATLRVLILGMVDLAQKYTVYYAGPTFLSLYVSVS
jgi:hypothetical protein